MPSNKPLIVGEKQFKTQKAANSFIRELLNAQRLTEPIPEPHHSFLCALISRHRRAKEKVGVGIRHFTVEHGAYGTRCFYLTRADGSKTDFSYLKCVRGVE